MNDVRYLTPRRSLNDYYDAGKQNIIVYCELILTYYGELDYDIE